MYQSPVMQKFREMGAMEDVAKKQQDHRILREEVLETARETGGNVPDISHVSAAVSQQANMTEALRQQMEGRSLIHISEPTRRLSISYAVICWNKKEER